MNGVLEESWDTALMLGYKKAVASITGTLRCLSGFAYCGGDQQPGHEAALWKDPHRKGSMLTNNHMSMLGGVLVFIFSIWHSFSFSVYCNACNHNRSVAQFPWQVNTLRHGAAAQKGVSSSGCWMRRWEETSNSSPWGVWGWGFLKNFRVGWSVKIMDWSKSAGWNAGTRRWRNSIPMLIWFLCGVFKLVALTIPLEFRVCLSTS